MKTKLILIGLFLGLLGIVFNGVYQDNKFEREAHEKKAAKKQEEGKNGGAKITIKLGDKEFSYGKNSQDQNKSDADNAINDDMPKNLKIYRLIGLICGVLAIGCGVFYYSLKGNPRMSAAMVGIGLICIAWEYALYAVGVAVVIIFLSALG